MSKDKKHEGITVRHQGKCSLTTGGKRCSCRPAYRAQVFDARVGRLIKKSFPSLAEARTWRQDATVAVRKGTLSATRLPRLGEAGAAWVAAAEAGTIRNRSGDLYKPSSIRGYETSLRLRVLPNLGHVRLGDITRADLQALVDRMLVAGHDPSTIRNTLMPVRAIFRRALVRGEVAINPTLGLELPAVRGRRDRIASPAEASALLRALPTDSALWAMAMYAGLRLGELLALQWSNVDMDRGIIRIRGSWDPKEGPIAPKSQAGVRDVPLAEVLRTYLAAHRLACASGEGLVFGRTPVKPFLPRTATDRAKRVWMTAGLTSIGLHECRHTFASMMIAAGVNAKALSMYMGHASVTITFDRYGHLMPGNEAEAAQLLDGYLARAEGVA